MIHTNITRNFLHIHVLINTVWHRHLLVCLQYIVSTLIIFHYLHLKHLYFYLFLYTKNSYPLYIVIIHNMNNFYRIIYIIHLNIYNRPHIIHSPMLYNHISHNSLLYTIIPNTFYHLVPLYSWSYYLIYIIYNNIIILQNQIHIIYNSILYYLYIYIIIHILYLLYYFSSIYISLHIMYNNNYHKNNYSIYNMLNVHDKIYHHLYILL